MNVNNFREYYQKADEVYFFDEKRVALLIEGNTAQILSIPIWVDNDNGYSYCNYPIWKELNFFTNNSGSIVYAYGNTDQQTNFHLGAIGNMEPILRFNKF